MFLFYVSVQGWIGKIPFIATTFVISSRIIIFWSSFCSPVSFFLTHWLRTIVISIILRRIGGIITLIIKLAITVFAWL
jgi:hypothetical protein